MFAPPLECNGCRACCLNEQIELHVEMGDDPRLYETVQKDGKTFIARREDGGKACRYLGKTGCTIHPTRPWLCRNFDCREYFIKLMQGRTRQQRRAKLKAVPELGPVMEAGKSRLRSMLAPRTGAAS